MREKGRKYINIVLSSVIRKFAQCQDFLHMRERKQINLNILSLFSRTKIK